MAYSKKVSAVFPILLTFLPASYALSQVLSPQVQGIAATLANYEDGFQQLIVMKIN